MTKRKVIEVLKEIQRQFITSICEADIGEEYAIEAREDNEEVVEALNMAIRNLSK
jgi:protoheme ferro-lyase